jgi:hypothetical protein
MRRYVADKEDVMLIQVIYTNNHYDYVKDFMLESLLASQRVAKFKRSSGWVTVGADPVRQKPGGSAYDGVERRVPRLSQ